MNAGKLVARKNSRGEMVILENKFHTLIGNIGVLL